MAKRHKTKEESKALQEVLDTKFGKTFPDIEFIVRAPTKKSWIFRHARSPLLEVRYKEEAQDTESNAIENFFAELKKQGSSHLQEYKSLLPGSRIKYKITHTKNFKKALEQKAKPITADDIARRLQLFTNTEPGLRDNVAFDVPSNDGANPAIWNVSASVMDPAFDKASTYFNQWQEHGYIGHWSEEAVDGAHIVKIGAINANTLFGAEIEAGTFQKPLPQRKQAIQPAPTPLPVGNNLGEEPDVLPPSELPESLPASRGTSGIALRKSKITSTKTVIPDMQGSQPDEDFYAMLDAALEEVIAAKQENPNALQAAPQPPARSSQDTKPIAFDAVIDAFMAVVPRDATTLHSNIFRRRDALVKELTAIVNERQGNADGTMRIPPRTVLQQDVAAMLEKHPEIQNPEALAQGLQAPGRGR